MFTIDLFAFGGGFASVPLMFHEIVHVRGWMDGPTFLNGIVLGQITPGPIVITATFVGYALYGFWGGPLATISVFLPSFLLVVGIAPYSSRVLAILSNYPGNPDRPHSSPNKVSPLASIYNRIFENG